MLKKIYLITTPIGDIDDISLKALELLKRSDIIIAEELKSARKLLNLLKIEFKNKNLYELNEHNEKKEARHIAENLITEDGTVSLISEGGMPVIADPGSLLVQELTAFDVKLIPVGSNSSILAALQISGFSAEHFYFAGFMPRPEPLRRAALMRLRNIHSTIIILETPYRLPQILKTLKKSFSPFKKIALCFNLATPRQFVFRGTVDEAVKKYPHKLKNSPFVIILDNNGGSRRKTSQT